MALNWFRSYLIDRKQYIDYHNTISDIHTLTCGVPQGSVQVPLLFILYINDLPDCLTNSEAILFADDTSIYCSHRNIVSLYDVKNIELYQLLDLFKANKLNLTISKTNYMLCPNKNETQFPIE